MKIGDYVRTKNGTILKIKDKDYLYVFETEYREEYKVVKSSPNIIDLIEVGDYVNGREVREVYDLGFGKCFCFKNEYGRHYDETYKIKSIVTKEQFESIEYKVVE